MLNLRSVLPLTLAVAVIATGAVASLAVAEDSHLLAFGKHGGKGHGDCKHGNLSEKLSLTEAQTKQVDAIRDSFEESHESEIEAKRAEMKELWSMKKDGKLTADEFTERKKALKEQYSGLREARMTMWQEIRAVLTPEQAQKFDEMKDEWHKKGGVDGQDDHDEPDTENEGETIEEDDEMN